MFTVTRHPGSNIVEAALFGFFDPTASERYAAEVEPIIHHAARLSNGYLMLFDISGCPIQSQEVMAAFQRHVARVPERDSAP